MLPQLRGNVTAQILVAMALALVAGTLINTAFAESALVKAYLVDGWLRAIGQMFMGALKMMVVPLVFFGLACGVAGIGDVSKMGRMGGKALVLYVFTTVVAISMALLVASLVGVGAGQAPLATEAAGFTAKDAPSIADIFIGMIPDNPLQAMASGDMLPVIFFTLLFGLALALAGSRGKPLLSAIEAGNEVMLKMVTLIMRVAPIGIFCLMTKIFAENGINLILPLLKYFLVMVFVLGLHMFGTYGLLLTLVGRLNPAVFFTKMKATQLFAFSTASSSATIPVTLRTTEKRLGADSAVASFSVPLGATLNMDGTAIMQGVATVFVANAYGIDLSLTDFLTVIGTATLASIGTAGVRGAGIIMLAMVFQQVGLPVDGIMLIMAVDPILDMIRTAVNVTGDATITTLVAKGEGALDMATFNDVHAGAVDEKSVDFHHLDESGESSVVAP